MLDLSMAYAQLAKHGSITNSMMLVCAFQLLYVVDGLYHEPLILSTMDIVSDGFGWMLSFGDLVWVPMVYSLQARYLVDYPVHLEPYMVVLSVVMYLAGFVIFRGANKQKNTFRTDALHPSVRDLKFIVTERGRKLLVDGWWGMARHVNYLGDLLVGMAFCLPCGFEHGIPYFFIVYFAILLIHRDIRDGHECEKKYGKDWKRYTELVAWRIIPYVY